MRTFKKALPLAFSFLLPPQIVTHEWDWQKQGWTLEEEARKEVAPSRQVTIKKARRIDKISDRAFLHRWTQLSPDQSRVLWPDLDSGSWVSVNAWTGGGFRERGRWTVSSLKSFSNPSRLRLAGMSFGIEGDHDQKLQLKDPKRKNTNLWNLELQGKNFEWQSDGVLYLTALDRELNNFYWINPRSFKRIARWEWPKDVEIVELLMCSGREMLLVENLWEHGLARVVGFRDGKPKWYTVFDFSNGKRKTIVSQVLSSNCRDVYFATTVGLYRVSY